MAEDWTKRVKSLMRERQMTQDDLAPLLGVSTQPSVSAYLRGESKLTLKQAENLARYFGVSLDFIAAGKRLDQPAIAARQAVATIIQERLTETNQDPVSVCKQFAGLDHHYLTRLLDREMDIGYNDIRTLGPMLGSQAAAELIDVIARRDGPPVKMEYR